MKDLAARLRGAGRRARGAERGAGLGRRRGRDGRDVRPRQPQGAGHRRREADPGRQDDQLREGQHRRRADRRTGGDGQPDPGLRLASPSSVGSRIGVQQNVWDLDGFLCAIVQQSGPAGGQRGPRLHAVRADRRVGHRRARQRPPGRRARPRPPATSRRAERDPRSSTVQETYAVRRHRHARGPVRRRVMRPSRAARRRGRRGRRAAAALLIGLRVRRRLRPPAARLAGRRGQQLPR